MKFTVAHGRIRCSRFESRTGSYADYKPAVDFDEWAGMVPSCVKEKLTVGEIRQLLAFLTDRRCAQPESGDSLLVTLPERLFQATEILYNSDRIDGRMYKEVAEALQSLNTALEIVRVNQLSRK